MSTEQEVELIRNKLDKLEAVIMCHIGAVDLLVPGTAGETSHGLRVQADAAMRRGNGLGHALLHGAADDILKCCDLDVSGDET